MKREVGGGFRMGDTCTPMADSCECMAKTTTILSGNWPPIKINIFLKKLFNVSNGFLGSSAGKESTYNAGDPGLIPGSGRLTGEGIGYPLQYSWAYLVA